MARNTGARIAIGSLAALSISLAATTAIVLADDAPRQRSRRVRRWRDYGRRWG